MGLLSSDKETSPTAWFGPDDLDLRREALAHANSGESAEDVVKRARAYLAFLQGDEK